MVRLTSIDALVLTACDRLTLALWNLVGVRRIALFRGSAIAGLMLDVVEWRLGHGQWLGLAVSGILQLVLIGFGEAIAARGPQRANQITLEIRTAFPALWLRCIAIYMAPLFIGLTLAAHGTQPWVATSIAGNAFDALSTVFLFALTPTTPPQRRRPITATASA
jgi:hypothetical protein